MACRKKANGNEASPEGSSGQTCGVSQAHQTHSAHQAHCSGGVRVLLEGLEPVNGYGQECPHKRKRLSTISVDSLYCYAGNDRSLPLRSAAAASEALSRYELPLPGSPPVKLLTLEQFKKFCYGAATLLIGSSTYSAISHPNSSVLACVLGGAVPALALVSTASVAEFLDNYLNGQAAKAKRTARRASPARTRKAA